MCVILTTKYLNKGETMPITNKEASTIRKIVDSYINKNEAKQMFDELVEEVADTTDNDSVKQSILMLSSLYERE